MRITHRAIADSNVRNMNANLAAVAKLQEQISSGKQLTRPSDSPSGTSTAMRTRGDLTANEQYTANINTTTTVLNGADSALDAMGKLLLRVQELTTQGANTGVNSSASFEALATEVEGIGESLLSLANRTVNGRPVFGGATSGDVAFDASGSFVGRADVPVAVRVSATETVRTDLAGPDAFGPDGGNVFDLVKQLAVDLRTNPSALSGRLTEIEGARARMSEARALVGVRTNRLEQVSEVNTDAVLQLRTQLSGVEDVDQAKTYLELQMKQTGYQAALSATAKSMSVSLVDFIS